MSIINNVYMPNFSEDEFSENPNRYADPRLLRNYQQFRSFLGCPMYPSKASGALARTEMKETDSNKDFISCHYVDPKAGIFSTAIDTFFECNIFKAWMVAFSGAHNLWSGIGVYFDTNGNDGKPRPMLHLDLREKPLMWYRDNGKYVYPHTDRSFYSNLQYLFAKHL